MPGNPAAFFIRMLFFLALLPACATAPRPSRTGAAVAVHLQSPETLPEPPEARRTRVLAHMLKLAEKPLYTARDVNAALAAGPFSAQEGVHSLLAGLDDPQSEVRENARFLLWRLPDEFLPELVRQCPKRHRLLAAQIALARGNAAAGLVPEIMAWYDDAPNDADTRMAVFNAAGTLAPERPDVMDLMRRGLSDADERIRLFAVSFLIDDPDAASSVKAVLSVLRLSRDPSIADCALFWIHYQQIRLRAQVGARR